MGSQQFNSLVDRVVAHISVESIAIALLPNVVAQTQQTKIIKAYKVLIGWWIRNVVFYCYS